MIDKDYSHLLCRPEHTFDEKGIDRELLTKNILVTGAGGSIGSALSRRINKAHPNNLYLLGHGEDSIFQLLQRFRDEPGNGSVHPMISDVQSGEVATLLRDGSIDFVFHTAAHKHVGLMESNPRAAFANNTQTTIWLARQCEKHSVPLIYVSTDKAVKPTTVMGASKKLAEAWIDANCKLTRTIRLGNVLGSAGSLVEIVERKAADGAKFTLNHPDMARFFVTAKEAVGLALSTLTLRPGKYCLDMGKPLRIDELVRKISPSIEIFNDFTRVGNEKLEEDMKEDDEFWQPLEPDCPILGLNRKVEPKLISAVLEIIEDHANSRLGAHAFGQLMVDMARRV